jgi:RIB43A
MNRKDCSGLRRLDGEDLDYGDRLYKQQYQQKLWIEQQTYEKSEKKRQEEEAERQLVEYNRRVNEERKKAEEDFNSRQTAMERSCVEANKQLLKEKLAREKAEKDFDHSQGFQHISYTTSSKFMTEDPSTGQSQLAPHRVIPYHFKGFNEAQKNEIIQTQKKQVFDKQEKNRIQKEKEMAEARMTEAQRRALVLYERETKLKKDRVNAEAREYLKTQMKEHQEKNADPYNESGNDYLIPL